MRIPGFPVITGDDLVDELLVQQPTRRAFSPSQLSLLKVWIRADDVAGADGAAVSAWADQSGNGNNFAQGTGANQPLIKHSILNGHKVVRFDGSNDFMKTAAFGAALSQPTTIFTVGKAVGTAVAQTFHDGIAVGNRHLLQKTTTPQWLSNAGSSISGGTADDSFHVFSSVYDGANSAVYRDGTLVASGNAGAHTLTGVIIGARYDETAQRLNGDIAELIVVNRLMTNQERKQVSRYLGQKYALSVQS